MQETDNYYEVPTTNLHEWFDKDTYDYKGIGTYHLIKFFPNEFLDWYDGDKIDWVAQDIVNNDFNMDWLKCLEEFQEEFFPVIDEFRHHFSQHQHVWGPDYIEHVFIQEDSVEV